MRQHVTIFLFAILLGHLSPAAARAGDAFLGVQFSTAYEVHVDYTARQFFFPTGAVAIPDRTKENRLGGILDHERTFGARVQKVVNGGPADLADLREEDIVVRFNDVVIRTHETFSAAINSVNAGDTVRLQFLRNGQLHRVEVKLGAKGDAVPPRKIPRDADEAYQELKDVRAKFYPEKEELADRIEAVNFDHGGEVSDRSLDYISKLQHLQTVVYPMSTGYRTHPTPVGLTKLGAMKSLRTLHLKGNFWTDEMLAPLLQPQVTKLILIETALTDATIARIAKLTNLEHLVIEKSKFSPAAAAQLAALTKIRHLELVGVPLPKGIDFLKGMLKLEYADLDSCELRDPHFAALASLTGLQLLDV
ncbi:MAG: PDZ domain-containing protein, partial [Gemmataceae bacterium]